MIDEIKIMQYADGTLPEDEKEAVEKAIESNPKLKKLFKDCQETADISDKINLSTECNKVLSVIKSMGEKCREILMMAADELAYKEMAEKIDTPIGTVMSRLANCRKELKGLMAQ